MENKRLIEEANRLNEDLKNEHDASKVNSYGRFTANPD